MTDRQLILIAEKAMENAYAPYSGFKVGAALLAENGAVYSGCNTENASYPAGICAERAALAAAVTAGERKFLKLAVVGGKSGVITDFCTPCGICRQALSEFGGDTEILLFDGGKIKKYRLSELLPESFGRDSL